MSAVAMGDRSLTDVLAELGYQHRAMSGPAAQGRRQILRAGRVVFAGSYCEVLAWLRERGEVAPEREGGAR